MQLKIFDKVKFMDGKYYSAKKKNTINRKLRSRHLSYIELLALRVFIGYND